MISNLIGSIDYPAALAIVAIVLGLAGAFLTFRTTREKPRWEKEADFEIQRATAVNATRQWEIREANSHEQAKLKIANAHAAEMEQVRGGLITSHSDRTTRPAIDHDVEEG